MVMYSAVLVCIKTFDKLIIQRWLHSFLTHDGGGMNKMLNF